MFEWLRRQERVEWLLAGGLLFFFVLLQVNAINQGNFAAQDFQRHCESIRDAAKAPWETFKRPLTDGHGLVSFYHVIGGAFYVFLGEAHTWAALAVANLLVSVLGLVLIYALLRRLVSSRVVRLSAFAFIVFLPLNVITSVVLSADAPVTCLLMLIIWAFILAADRLKERKPATGFMAAAGFFLILAFLIKMTFMLCLAGVLVILLMLWRYGLLSGAAFVKALLAAFALPLIVIMLLHPIYVAPKTHFLGGADKIPAFARMDFRSLFFFREHDAELLDPPYFHEFRFMNLHSVRPMHINNYYSYPAMLHVGIFTDLLNIYQPIVYPSSAPWVEDEYYSRIRPPENQERMRLAVRTALVFSAGFLLAGLWWMGRCWRAVRERKNLEYIPHAILFLIGMPLYLGMTLILPFTRWTYAQGYWLPRFVLPVLLLGYVLLFAAIDRYLVSRAGWVRWLIFILVMFQSVLHVSFLWVCP